MRKKHFRMDNVKKASDPQSHGTTAGPLARRFLINQIEPIPVG